MPDCFATLYRAAKETLEHQVSMVMPATQVSRVPKVKRALKERRELVEVLVILVTQVWLVPRD